MCCLLNFPLRESYIYLSILQKPREYPLSCHDNKYSLKDDISVFTQVSTFWWIQVIIRSSHPPEIAPLKEILFSPRASGCGAMEVSWWSQTEQLPPLPVPRWSWQQQWGCRGQTQQKHLQKWLYSDGSCWCSSQNATVPLQSQAEVWRGGLGTGEKAVHVARTGQLRHLRDSGGSDSPLQALR